MDDPLSTAGGHILFPCMNFSYSGRITKLMFIAPTVNAASQSITQWPQFLLWRERELNEPIALNASNEQCNVYYDNGNYGIYELDFSSNHYTFQNGDFLGVSYSGDCQSGCQRLNILYQNGGGYCDAVIMTLYNSSGRRVNDLIGPLLPYIGLEIGKSLHD